MDVHASPGPRRPWSVRLPLLPALALTAAALLLTGCRGPDGGVTDDRGPIRPAPAPSAYGVVFLGPDDCSSRGPGIREVSCRSEKAAARVLARHLGAPSSGPLCPPATDFVLHVSETGERAGSRLSTGYACMRNLEPPHLGDPGRGGGPLTVVGDCVTASRAGEVTETACADAGGRAPRYRVESAVRRREQCPDTTDLFVSLHGKTKGGDGRPVGCARRFPDG